MVKNHEIICTYGGYLKDIADAKYMDPTYTVAFERNGLKLIGDDMFGDMGHFANSTYEDTTGNLRLSWSFTLFYVSFW